MRWWRRYLEWRLRNVRRISLLPDGFATKYRQVETIIQWDDVSHVLALKRDLYTVDLLCLLVATDEMIAEVSEDDPGYSAFEEEMTRRLDISPEWKLSVIFPAFESNPTEIFSRERTSAPAS